LTNNRKRFSKKTVIVTGAGRGVGREIALGFAEEGASVLITDIDKEKLNDLEAVLSEKGRSVISIGADISCIKDVRAVADRASNAFGSIDILVNNAGISMTKDMLELSESDWDKVFNVNVKGTFFMLQAAAESMIKTGKKGSIVNIASVAGEKGRPLFLAYSASKAAVISITKSSALGLVDRGIRVNAVAPGTIDTPMWDNISKKMSWLEGADAGMVKKSWLEKIPMKRLAAPSDIASMVLYLCSDEASYITGQTFNVCGGISLL
jgi:NAD(P)-dependent dehydrogenase (short-subunit alcohol dehydrogenase family)